ncbi:hypothetical protein KFE25_012003 [Diacronema lutheri]|uniref:Protein C10 n=2 Tax=Diacronema lutheri TaxID=2081491 RepID=A0A8J5XC20_DIALT|nr:hypothetical protein KFE25_012003 [Diacronema lutheri]
MASPPPTLTLEQAKQALAEAIESFNTPDNISRIRAAAAAVPEEQRAMAVLPIVQQIQAAVLAKYGFAGPTAVFAGIMALKAHEADPEVKEGLEKVMHGFMEHVKNVA